MYANLSFRIYNRLNIRVQQQAANSAISPAEHRATQLFISYFNYAIYASYKLILHISSLYTETE